MTVDSIELNENAICAANFTFQIFFSHLKYRRSHTNCQRICSSLSPHTHQVAYKSTHQALVGHVGPTQCCLRHSMVPHRRERLARWASPPYPHSRSLTPLPRPILSLSLASATVSESVPHPFSPASSH